MQLLTVDQAKTRILDSLSLIDEGLPIYRMSDILVDSFRGSTEIVNLFYHALLHIKGMNPSKRKNICFDLFKFSNSVFKGQIRANSVNNKVCKDVLSMLIKDAFIDSAKYWPKYSGSEGYPVPYAFPPKPGDLSPYGAFWETHSDFLWKGNYGALRQELLEFCIKFCEEQLKNSIYNEAYYDKIGLVN